MHFQNMISNSLPLHIICLIICLIIVQSVAITSVQNENTTSLNNSSQKNNNNSCNGIAHHEISIIYLLRAYTSRCVQLPSLNDLQQDDANYNFTNNYDINNRNDCFSVNFIDISRNSNNNSKNDNIDSFDIIDGNINIILDNAPRKYCINNTNDYELLLLDRLITAEGINDEYSSYVDNINNRNNITMNGNYGNIYQSTNDPGMVTEVFEGDVATRVIFLSIVESSV